MTNTFNWVDYRALSYPDDKIKEKIIRSAFLQFVQGNDCYEDYGTSETMIAWENFRAGFLVSQCIMNESEAPLSREDEEDLDW